MFNYTFFQASQLEKMVLMKILIIGSLLIHQWNWIIHQIFPLLPGFIAMSKVWNVSWVVWIYILNLNGAKLILISLALFLSLIKMEVWYHMTFLDWLDKEMPTWKNANLQIGNVTSVARNLITLHFCILSINLMVLYMIMISDLILLEILQVNQGKKLKDSCKILTIAFSFKILLGKI